MKIISLALLVSALLLSGCGSLEPKILYRDAAHPISDTGVVIFSPYVDGVLHSDISTSLLTTDGVDSRNAINQKVNWARVLPGKHVFRLQVVANARPMGGVIYYNIAHLEVTADVEPRHTYIVRYYPSKSAISAQVEDRGENSGSGVMLRGVLVVPEFK